MFMTASNLDHQIHLLKVNPLQDPNFGTDLKFKLIQLIKCQLKTNE